MASDLGYGGGKTIFHNYVREVRPGVLAAWRDHIAYGQLDQLAHEGDLRAPVLLFQATADTVVSPSLATAFARRRRGLVTYVRVRGADHVSSIDTDPVGYRSALRTFLSR